MLAWGVVALLPFSISSVFALIGNDLAISSAVVGFVGFTGWFFFVCALSSKASVEQSQRVVEEKDLAEWLQSGWVVVTVLQSGRVVIE